MNTQFQRFVATILLLSMTLQSCSSNLKLDAEPKAQRKQLETTKKPTPPAPLKGGQADKKRASAPPLAIPTTPVGPPSQSIFPQPTGAPLQAFKAEPPAKPTALTPRSVHATTKPKQRPSASYPSAQPKAVLTPAKPTEQAFQPNALQAHAPAKHIPVTQPQETLPTPPSRPLPEEPFTTRAGQQVQLFQNPQGQWQAQVKERLGHFERQVTLPVYCEPGCSVEKILKYQKAQLQHMLDLALGSNFVYLGSKGLLGGMTKGEELDEGEIKEEENGLRASAVAHFNRLNLSQYEACYDNTALKHLASTLRGAQRSSLRVVFQDSISRSVLESLIRPFSKQQGLSEQDFIEQLTQLKVLQRITGRKAALFISKEPTLALNHYVFGMLYENKLFLFSPLGASSHQDFYQVLAAVRAQGLVDEIYLSTTSIQQAAMETERLVSCGPISAELLRHYGAMGQEHLEETISRLCSAGQGQTGGVVDYQAIDISECLPASLLALKEARERNAYQVQARMIRRLHLERLAQVHESPEQELLNKLVVEQKSITELQVSEAYSQLVSEEIRSSMLMQAVENGELERVRELLRICKGAELEAKDASGHTALINAQSKGYQEIVDLLKTHKLRQEEERTAKQSRNASLRLAAKENNLRRVKELLVQDVEVDSKDDAGNAALMHAARAGQVEICKLLLDHGAEVDTKGSEGNTALMNVVRAGHIADKEGNTPFFMNAERAKHVAICKLLLDHGAEVDTQDESGNTALMHAVRARHAMIVALLLYSGADVYRQNNAEETPLLIAGREYENNKNDGQEEVYGMLLCRAVEKLTQQGSEQAQKAYGKETIAILGNTGVGKSTFINYLAGCQMNRRTRRELGLTGIGPIIEAENPLMRIGHDQGRSETLIPQVGTRNGLAYCDLPGFADSRGHDISIANAINIKKVLTAARGIKMVVLASYASVIEERGAALRKLLEDCIRFFGIAEKFVANASSILLGITRVPPGEVTLEDLQAYMRDNTGIMEAHPEILSTLADRLFIFDPLNEGAQRDRRAQIATLPSMNPASIFENPGVALEDKDSTFLTAISESMRKKFSKELAKARSYGFATEHLTPALSYLNMLEELHKVIPLQAVKNHLEHAEKEAASEESWASLQRFGWGMLGIVGVGVGGIVAIVCAGPAVLTAIGVTAIAAQLGAGGVAIATIEAEEKAEAEKKAEAKVIGSVKAEAKNLQPRHSSSSKSKQQQKSKRKK